MKVVGNRQIKDTRDMMPEEYLKILVNLSEGIFHDFKNTLAIISGLSQLSASKVDSKEVKDNLKIINESTFECRDAIDRFYGFINGYSVKDKKANSLRHILFTILDMVKYELNSVNTKGHYIETNLTVSTVGQIYGNEYELKQGILNIVLNAIQSMENTGGTLDIRLYEKEDHIILEIEDTGTGIAEENIGKIFEPKFTTKGDKGTGLGLIISKNIMEENDGEISFKSELGKGTKFTIKFPIVE
ncbi:sensor histidine kinase [Tissierella creatinophila]|uniref:sensor histidine kinase n=1 Tax=Tissierella creatinophila TaxID=79681 RepID=UPI000951AA50|nr:HAMP domain-containing sensor histidine kinase [Tissierella creatinophila]